MIEHDSCGISNIHNCVTCGLSILERKIFTRNLPSLTIDALKWQFAMRTNDKKKKLNWH